MSAEFSYLLDLGRVGTAGLDIAVRATAAECAALAARLQLPAIAFLTCRFRLQPFQNGAMEATGAMAASITQICILSLDEFPAKLAENFTIRFVPAGTESDTDDPDSIDEIPYIGTAIDLGEVAAEQLALALDPYPRKPDADLPNVGQSAPETPFAALAALRPKPGSKD